MSEDQLPTAELRARFMQLAHFMLDNLQHCEQLREKLPRQIVEVNVMRAEIEAGAAVDLERIARVSEATEEVESSIADLFQLRQEMRDCFTRLEPLGMVTPDLRRVMAIGDGISQADA